ncbi:L-ribulose-5-phosphate 4-epimerase [candidate division KSB1 bacterium]|nr:L-ribulose-5-phosphate 4-epimerase [candidate division KSB1 bacterium]
MSIYQSLKEQAWEANMELPKRGVVIYTFGNVSALDKDRAVFAIKPSGVPYDVLKADEMVVVDLENKIVEGKLNPSSDTKTHIVLYRHFDSIGGVTHTHSTYATAWAQAARAIPIYGTTHADHLAGEIPCTAFMTDEAIKKDYEEETGHQIISIFQDLNPSEVEMVLVAGHGPFTWGKTAAKSVYNAVVLEELARMACFTEKINPQAAPLKQALIDKHYHRKHGKNAYYGQK